MSEADPTSENVLIFAFLVVLGGAVLIVYIVAKTEFHYLPERYVLKTTP